MRFRDLRFETKYVSLLLVWTLVGTTVHAQDAYEEFERIVNAYQSSQLVSYQAHYYYFDDLQTDEASDSLTMEMIQRKGLSYMATPDHIIISEKNRTLTVNKLEQEIYLQKQVNSSVFDLQQMKKTADEIGLQLESFDAGKDKKGLAFVAPQASKTRIELIYDPTTYLLIAASTSIDVRNGAYQGEFNQSRFEATYSDYKYLKKFPHPISSMVRSKGDKWTGVGDYQAYEVTVF